MIMFMFMYMYATLVHSLYAAAAPIKFICINSILLIIILSLPKFVSELINFFN